MVAMSNAAALALLTEACAVLGEGAVMERGHLIHNGLHVASACKDNGKVWIREALIYDGFTFTVPAGLDESRLTPGSPQATVAKIVAAIRARLAARATSLPVPVDLSLSRDPDAPLCSAEAQ